MLSEAARLSERLAGSESEPPPQIMVVGHILNERVVFPDRVLYPVLGSPAAYSSICLAKLGVRVGLVTKVGPDFPEHLLSAFDGAGVGRRGIGRSRASTNNELIYQADGRKQIRFLSKADPIAYADIPSEYLSAPLVYICPMDEEIDFEMLRRLREQGRCMVVDLGGFGGATSAVHPPVKDGSGVARICPLFDLVKASTEDLEYILGIPAKDYEAAAAALLEWGSGAVVVTRGKDGAYVSTGGVGRSFPAYLEDPRSVVDQTGAGDCFSAGFLTHYLDSRDPFQAAVYGNVVTSFVIERTGGASVARMPQRRDADERAREFLAREKAAMAAG
jgi:sugar/nucleoside kinase (ribokinase family)